jgi:membrane-associated phospholipid phosphatase
MINQIIKVLDIIGQFTPNILFIISCYLLWNKKILLNYYIIGFFISAILNLFLKGIIKQPRPSEDIKLINIAINNGKRFGFDIYGMPSGHAQLSFYTTIFIYLALKNVKITILFLLLSLLTFYQRIKYKNHTINQVIAGSIIGTMLGYFVYYISTQKIKGKLISKSDDNAPY